MNKVLGLIIAGLGLLVLLVPLPDNFNGVFPMPAPQVEKDKLSRDIVDQVGEKDKEKLIQLAAALESAANLFEMDKSRSVPYYKDSEDMKWAARRINELSYPMNWEMQTEYPGLSELLASWIENEVGQEPTRNDIVSAFRKMAKSLRASAS